MCTCEYIILSIYDGGLPISSGEGILKEGADGPPKGQRLGWEPAGPWADAWGRQNCPRPAIPAAHGLGLGEIEARKILRAQPGPYV